MIAKGPALPALFVGSVRKPYYVYVLWVPARCPGQRVKTKSESLGSDAMETAQARAAGGPERQIGVPVPQDVRRSVVVQPICCSSYASTSAHSCSKNGEVNRCAKPQQFPIYGRLVEPTLRKLGAAPVPRLQDEFGVGFATRLTYVRLLREQMEKDLGAGQVRSGHKEKRSAAESRRCRQPFASVVEHL